MSDLDVDGEILAEEDAEPRDATEPVRPLAYEEPSLPVLRAEVRTAAIAAAEGVLAGAATVAVRAVGLLTRGLRPSPRPCFTDARTWTPCSFLVDVHLLGGGDGQPVSGPKTAP
ncbi:MAG: hypothetical protein U0R26_10870 [Solirubrobacterales bacterium]